MTLYDILRKLNPDTLVGIWNIDDKRAKCPTPQTYQRTGNIPWSKVCNILDYEVLTINVNDTAHGLLIQVYNEKYLEMNIRNQDLAEKLRKN